MIFEDLLALELKGDNLQQFSNSWEMVLAGIKEVPTEDILESLYKRQLQKSTQLEKAIALYDDNILHNGEKKSYERLCTIVRSHLSRKRLQKNQQVMRETLGGKGLAGKGAGGNPKKPKRVQGDCTQFMKTGTCSRGNKCPYNHDRSRAQPRGRTPTKDRNKPKGGGKSRSGSRPSRGTSPSGKADQKVCNF